MITSSPSDASIFDVRVAGPVRLDASVEPTVEPVHCAAPPAARTVRFVVTSKPHGGGHMHALLSSGNGELDVELFDAGSAQASCASWLTDGGTTLHFRCTGEVGEVRGEARWASPLLRVTKAVGYFGPTTGPRTLTVTAVDRTWPCATHVGFVATSRSDSTYDDKPWNAPAGFLLPFDQVEE